MTKVTLGTEKVTYPEPFIEPTSRWVLISATQIATCMIVVVILEFIPYYSLNFFRPCF